MAPPPQTQDHRKEPRVTLRGYPLRPVRDASFRLEENLPVPSISDDVSQPFGEIAELVGESHSHGPYRKEKGLYLVGYKPSCTIIGLARHSSDTSPEIPFLPIEDLTLIGPLLREQQAYSVFLIDASHQDTISAMDTIVREIAENKLYYNHRPLVSVVEKGREGLLPELVQRYAPTPFRFIKAQKYGNDVIDAQLFGQARY